MFLFCGMIPEDERPLLDPSGEPGGDFGQNSRQSVSVVMDSVRDGIPPPTSSTHVIVDRPVFPQSTLDEAYKCKTKEGYTFDFIRCSNCEPKKVVKSMIPSIDWLSKYNVKEDLPKDIISGITVGIMNIPQGMAYAILGNVPPVVGLYMAFFPTIVYAFLGTSRHVSMGSFAVICLMAGKTVTALSSPQSLNQGSVGISSGNGTMAMTTDHTFTAMEVAIAITFMVGVFQIVMYMFRLGVICSLLSDTLVNGLTAGAAIHVFTSQVKDLFGMHVPKYTGAFQLLRTYGGIFQNLHTINYAAAVLSLVTIIVLIINNELLKTWVSKRSIIPVPIELIVVLAGTLLSRYASIAEVYGLEIVGHIAVGVPEAMAPRFELLPKVALDSFIIAIVAYIISVSMALIFAQKLQYEIDSNQELLAQGVGNVVGSFFSCLPFSASLSRSLIQQTAGGRTQLASLFSSGIILVVLLWIAPFFEPLPRCFLASLIVVALKGVLFQVKDFYRIWKMSTLDGITWLCTYSAVILVEIDIGLLVGLLISILSIFIQVMKPYTCRLARLPNTDIYVDATRYKTEDIEGICIIHYAGGLNFANRNYFKKAVNQIANESSTSELEITDRGKTRSKTDISNKQINYIILNLSALQSVDPAGSLTILAIAQEYAELHIKVLLAGLSGPVHDTMKSCGTFDTHMFTCFPTIHDAVLYAESRMAEQRLCVRL